MYQSNRLASASSVSDRLTARRIGAALLRRIPFAGKSDALFLARNGFRVPFDEEQVPPLSLPRGGDHARSVNLFDQREVLFRALVVAALKTGIIDRRRAIIDVGAANGDSALSWSRLVDGTIYAIDPSAGNIAYIARVAAANGLANIDAFVLAVGDKDGILFPASDVSHTFFTDHPITRYGARHPVHASSFDNLFAQGRIADIGFLHLDVEGMELTALRGSVAMLAACRPVVAFECHVTIDDLDAIFALLRGLD